MSSPIPNLFEQITAFHNLLSAYNKAAKGKRSMVNVARFDACLSDQLLALQAELNSGIYRPGKYVHFFIHEPKRRRISAAPFRDRVVHHALCNVIEPLFESDFIADSYANRVGKGTHRAVDRFQSFSRRYRYVLRLDIVKHFPAMDHQVLLGEIQRRITDRKTLGLVQLILNSGAGIHDQEYRPTLFPGDDLLDLLRPKGLPIGNLTSQFWSNVYLHPLDCFVKRELSCKAYLRYVDDFALFANEKEQLWAWKQEIRTKLEQLRLKFHENSAQVMPVDCGIPWLGFVIYPDHRKLKARKAVHGTRTLTRRFNAWQQGEISFGEFDASLQGWINHVRYADTWGLRKHVLRRFRW